MFGLRIGGDSPLRRYNLLEFLDTRVPPNGGQSSLWYVLLRVSHTRRACESRLYIVPMISANSAENPTIRLKYADYLGTIHGSLLVNQR